MDRETLILHIIRGHDHSPSSAVNKTDEELRNWHALDHKAVHDHDHEED